MKKPNLIIAAALVIHAVAWFVPVIKGGVRLPEGIPGWEAFRFASCSIWPCKDVEFSAWYGQLLYSLSAVTTVLFVVGLPLILLSRSRLTRYVSAWIAAVSFVVNAHWYALSGSDRADLQIGYFLWWLSFGVLAAGLFVSARKNVVVEPASEAKAVVQVTN